MQYSLGVEEVGIRQRGPSSRRWETKAQVKPPAVPDEQAEAHTGLRKPELMFESGGQIPRLSSAGSATVLPHPQLGVRGECKGQRQCWTKSVRVTEVFCVTRQGWGVGWTGVGIPVGMCACLRVWRPKVNSSTVPQEPFNLFIETGSCSPIGSLGSLIRLVRQALHL